MPDIAVSFAGLKLQSPFMIASGPETTSPDKLKEKAGKIAESGWGAVVTKTLIPKSHMTVKPQLWTTGRFSGIAMQNLGPPMIEYSDDKIAKLEKSITTAHNVGLKVIVSIIEASLERYGQLAKRIEEIEADSIELNLSCPVGIKAYTEESIGGYRVGQIPSLSGEVVEAVKRSCDIPVIPKLTAHAIDIGSVALSCEKAGADGVSLINTIQGIIGVDINTGRLVSSDINENGYVSGISGPMIRPFGLRSVAQVALRTKLPISAIGGVEDYQSALEYFLLGARTVQLCTAVMWKGLGLGRKLVNGLEEYMKRKGYSSMEDIVGQSLKYLKSEVEMPSPQIAALIDQELCTGCGICYIACNDTAFEAIRKLDEKFQVEEDICGGCGLCQVVCKFNAISFKRKR